CPEGLRRCDVEVDQNVRVLRDKSFQNGENIAKRMEWEEYPEKRRKNRLGANLRSLSCSIVTTSANLSPVSSPSSTRASAHNSVSSTRTRNTSPLISDQRRLAPSADASQNTRLR